MSSGNTRYLRKRYIFISISIVCIGLVVCIGIQANAYAGKQAGEPAFTHAAPTCPAGLDRARSMVENFLTEPNLSDARSETGTTGLTVSDIAHLDNPDDTDVCEVLNDDFSHFDGDFRKVVYYQVGDYYFVVAPLVVPDASEYSIIGPDFIVVVDSDFNTLGRYRGQ